jgi:PIN domain nuclease of toxin-antitoxin system
MDRFLLDTHAWIWLQEGLPGISPRLIAQIDEARRRSDVYVSAVSVWEIGNLTARGRLELESPIDVWLQLALTVGRLQLAPFEATIALASARLPGAIHGDPADRMLVATARTHGLTLVTHDKLLLKYGKQGHVNVLAI